MSSSKRYQQPVVPGLGQHYTSPKRKGRHARRGDQARVVSLGRDVRLQALQAQLQTFERANNSAGQGADIDVTDDLDMRASTPDDCARDDGLDVIEPEITPIQDASTPKKPRRLVPDEKAYRFYLRFNNIIPALEEPYLAYFRQHLGNAAPSSFQYQHVCIRTGCSRSTACVVMLFWDHFETHHVEYCTCTTLPVVLMRNGMFPSSPSEPRFGISTFLLDFYSTLFERSGDAVTALAGALHKFYAHRGWPIVDEKGAPISDAFRRALGVAIQWFDVLRVNIETHTNNAIDSAYQKIASRPQDSTDPIPASDSISTTETRPLSVSQTVVDTSMSTCSSTVESTRIRSARCASILKTRCPACFGGRTFGSPVARGSDIHVALDGNFSHRHLRNAGESPSFYSPAYILSKEYVDKVGERIESLRKKPPKKDYVSKVPDTALDSCEHGHEAANEHKVKTADLRFDDTGLMALICRHDIPIYLTNIDTPGEQQKYAIALIEYLFDHLPADATVSALYDIGCLADRSINLWDLLPAHIIARLRWATSAMHAYGHEWACQMVYGPRFQDGMGQTDGEGVERLWSKLRIIIPVTRSSARSRRLWIVDRQAKSIGESVLDDLGAYIERRLRRANLQEKAAAEELEACGVGLQEIRDQWELQLADQTSVRKHAPARLKKNLDGILALHAEVDKLDDAISKTQSLFKDANIKSAIVTSELSALCATKDALASHVEKLYASLDIEHLPKELMTFPLEFLRYLLLARDLKEIVRKRAVANFIEWDRLDQAAGGRDVALGTKLHQETRKKITRRKPALLGAIRRYNSYCETLKKLRPSESQFPIPQPLPVDLVALRHDPRLMEDVWIATPSGTTDAPRWLEDEEVRKGITAMHKRQRALEEIKRCGGEAENLIRCFAEELLALEVSLRLPENRLYICQIRQRYDDHLLRQHRWRTSLITDFRYSHYIQTSPRRAEEICGIVSAETSLQWQTSITCLGSLISGENHDEYGMYDTIDDADSGAAEQVFLTDFIEEALGEHIVDTTISEANPFLVEPPNVTYFTDTFSATSVLVTSSRYDNLMASLEDGPRTDDHPMTFHEETHPTDDYWMSCESVTRPPDDASITSAQDTPSSSTLLSSIPLACNSQNPPPSMTSSSPQVLTPKHGVWAVWASTKLYTTDPWVGPPSNDYAHEDLQWPRKGHFGGRTVNLSTDDIARLANPQGWLNDILINDCAVLLRETFGNGPYPCAIFSTYEVDAVRTEAWECLRRLAESSRYQDSNIWLVPFHQRRRKHWTLVVLIINTKTIYHFDSFADEQYWKKDIDDAFTLLRQLSTDVDHDTFENWSAYPLCVNPCQTNGYDCGLWILASMKAVMNGFEVTGVSESRMPAFRNFLLGLVLQLSSDPRGSDPQS